jgi:hypothetical protein
VSQWTSTWDSLSLAITKLYRILYHGNICYVACNYLSAHYRVWWPGFVQQRGRKVLRKANQILSFGQLHECFVHFCDLTISRDETFYEAANKATCFWNSSPYTRSQPKSLFPISDPQTAASLLLPFVFFIGISVQVAIKQYRGTTS